ncbi:MAG TPA: DUF1800 family protein [Pirellulaceae bacterium]|nr:DUF1800 family protein [Pirellulaceae bacterium]
MKKWTKHSSWVLAVMAAGFGAAGLTYGAEKPPKPAKVDPALAAARKQESVARTEVSSRGMARSATREIARSERRRAEGALENWRAAETALKEAIAEKKPKAQVAALRTAAQKQLATRRTATERLIADTITANKASHELFVSEFTTRDKMAATRTVELKLLDPKARAAAIRTVELTLQEEKEKEAKAQAKRAATLQRDLHTLESLRAMEIQQWAAIRKDTAEELAEQSGEAARIARELAAVETDAEQKKRLEEFAGQQTKEEATADQIVAEAVKTIADAAPEIYTHRSAAMGGLKPLAPDQWNYAKARHLLVRAGFGGTPQEVEKLHAMGLYKAVDHFVEFYRQASDSPSLDPMTPFSVDPLRSKMRIRGTGNRAVGLDSRSVEANQLVQIRRWWLQRLVESPRPLQEKLTLFWHGHFASQNSVVQNSYTMFRQNQFFREHAAGNFGAMLYGVVHDPAMIRYLDNNKNIKGNPNENLAREIMELFSMGVDQGYTEKDIVEAARSLTGYNFDHATGTYRFLYDRHDTTEKTIFGKTGTWTGDDLVRLILERPETSRFISLKLFEYFAYQDPEKATVNGLADVLKDRRFALEPMLKNLFLSEQFYSSRSMGKQVKSPVELMVGLLRDLGAKPLVVHQPIEKPLPKSDGSRLVVDESLTSYETLDKALQEMGMQLMEPPDVKGWRYGRPWIDSQRLFVRYNAVASLIDAVGQKGVDVVSLIQAGGCKNSVEAVDYLARTCLVRPLDAAKRKELIAHLGELPPRGEWASQHGELNVKLRSLLMLMLCVPEHQMS